MKIRLIVLIVFSVALLFYVLIDLSVSTKKFSYLKTLVPKEIRSTIKKNMFPYGYIRELKKEIQTSSHLKTYFFIIEI